MRCLWLLLAFVAGCYDPSFQVGLPCSEARGCPDGQICAADNTCQLGAIDHDGGPGGLPDGSPLPPDAALPLESWLVSFEHPALARADDVAAAAGGFALVGSSAGDGVVIHLDPTGQIRWQVALDAGGGEFASAVTESKDGMVIAGSSSSSLLVSELSGRGQLLWAKTYLDQDSSSATDILETAAGDGFLVVGNSYPSPDPDLINSVWLLRLDGDGQVQWQRRFSLGEGVRADAAVETADGGFVVTGVIDGDPLTERDMLLFKVNASGVPMWQRRISGGDNEWGSDVLELADQSLVVVGGTWSSTLGQADVWVVKMSGDGSTINSQFAVGTSQVDYADDVFVRPGGNLWVAGTTVDDTDSYEMFVLDIATNESIASQRRIGTNVSDTYAGAAATDEGLVVLGDGQGFTTETGFFAGSVVLPDGLPAGCAEQKTGSATKGTSPGVASGITMTVTDTSATATDVTADSSTTSTSIGMTAQCE